MIFSTMLHIKDELLSLIFTSYLNGHSVEEIMLICQLMKYENCSIEEINNILDFLIEINF